jgi:hypothetical protein
VEEEGPELCALLGTGVGGIPLGLAQIVHRFEPVLYVERDLLHASVLVRAIDDGEIHPAPIWLDRSTLPDLPNKPQIRSVAGSLKLQTEFQPVRTFISQHRVEWVFFQLPATLLDPSSIDLLCDFWYEFDRFGYRHETGLFSPAEVGTPIWRPTLFIFAVLAGHLPPRLSVPSWASVPLGPIPHPLVPVAFPRHPYREFGPTPIPHFRWPASVSFPQAYQQAWEDERLAEPTVVGTITGPASPVDRSRHGRPSERLRLLQEASIPPLVSMSFATLCTRLIEKSKKCQSPKAVTSPTVPGPSISSSTDDVSAFIAGRDIVSTMSPLI